MTNYILQNREKLKGSNYIRKAKPRPHYWLDFSYGKLQDYILRCGDQFNIIVVGSDQDETDFYVIPFGVLRHMFTEEYLADDVRERKRWHAYIIDGQFHVTHCPVTLDIRRYRGNRSAISI